MRYLEHISAETRFLDLPGPFPLDSGGLLPRVRVAYRTWGRRNATGDNGVLVCHALTGSADVDDWWGKLLGPRRALDPDRDFIICSNVLGGCYGTTGPTSEGPAFPSISIRDMVRLQAALLDALGVRSLEIVVGGSMGGMQVLEWGALYPERVRSLIPIAISARHSPWCIGISEAQRAAIRADPAFKDGAYAPDEPPAAGFAVARMIAMTSYRSWEGFQRRFGRRRSGRKQYQVESYLRYQGEKLVTRFDANSYIALTEAMDRFDLGLGRGPYEAVLDALRMPALVISVDSDVLYPPQEQEELARLMPQGELAVVSSAHGHDGFLLEAEAVGEIIAGFRQRSATFAVA